MNMSTTSSVTFGSIDVITNRLDGHKRRVTLHKPLMRLSVYTRTGQARFAELDERDLLKIIGQAAVALDKVRAHREQLAREVGIEL